MRIGIMSASVHGEDLRENRRLVEEIAALGHEASVINYRRTAVAITEAGRLVLSFDDRGREEPVEVDAVIPRIGRYVESGTLVLRALISNGVYSTASPDAVMLAKDKMTAQIALDAAGIPTPYSVAPSGRTPDNPIGMLRLVEPDPKKPTVIKTTRGSHGRGVSLAESRRSAKSQVQSLASSNVSYLVQEFAEAPEVENLHSDIRLIVVEGRVVAAMKRQAKDEDEFRSNLALGAEGVAYDPTPRERELAERSAQAIGLSVGGIDIMPSTRGPLVSEVNVSPEFGIEVVTGVNVARAIAELAVRKGLERSSPVPLILDLAAAS